MWRDPTMRIFMAPPINNRQVIATSTKARAILALVAPLLAWGYAVATLWGRGYSLLDYPLLIEAGYLNLTRQAVGLALTAYWIARYWPNAIQALRRPSLIWQERNNIGLAAGMIVPIEEIEAVNIRHGFLNKVLEIKCRNGQEFRQSILFIKENDHSVLHKVRITLTAS